MQLCNAVLSLLVGCHKLSTEFAKPQDWSLWSLLCLPATSLTCLQIYFTLFSRNSHLFNCWGVYRQFDIILFSFMWYHHRFYKTVIIKQHRKHNDTWIKFLRAEDIELGAEEYMHGMIKKKKMGQRLALEAPQQSYKKYRHGDGQNWAYC